LLFARSPAGAGLKGFVSAPEQVEGHGHWVMLENPERVASLVIPFLSQQLPGPTTAAGSPASPPTSS
jgi:hypothetical protein